MLKNIPGPCMSLRHNCIEEEKKRSAHRHHYGSRRSMRTKKLQPAFSSCKIAQHSHSVASSPIAPAECTFFVFTHTHRTHSREKLQKFIDPVVVCIQICGVSSSPRRALRNRSSPERDEANGISPEKFAFRIMHKNYASLADVDKYLIFSFFEQARF